MLLWWLGLLGLCGGAWAACPQYCSCFVDLDGYVSANCSVQALDQSANTPASNVEMLSFQPSLGGYPTRLEPRTFLPFRQVKFLWMVNCSVLNLPNDVFHGLVYVIRLDLSYNKIRHLNGAVFKPMDSLTTLKLRSNPLQLTPWDVIVSDSLQELDLGHCGLRTIPFGTFGGVPRLSRLYLDGNSLRTLTYNTVPATLRYVNLSRNRIFNVPTEVLTSMSLLRKIDLSKNPVNCTCNLLLMQDWFSGQGILLDNDINCVEPNQYKGMRLSKINENELCTLEEVKRQRRINDIQSYRDSKSHRTHNMINDPDLQSDQPNGQNYAEILFHDKGGHTHMEMNAKHYSVLPTDLSSENNKVANSKQETHSMEMELASPTREMGVEGEDDSSKEELSHDFTSESTIKMETVSTGSQISASEAHDLKENLLYHKPDNTTLSVDNASDIPSYVNEIGVSEFSNVSRSPHDELADEGYSPVYNMSDIMLSDGEGSGDDSLLTKSATSEETPTPTLESFTFPSSHSDGTDYSYDSHHDYSSEVTGSTTEAITAFEGSGEPENETLITDTMTPISREEEMENDTTTETYLITAKDSWTSEDYNASSAQYSSTSEHYTTEESTTELSSSSEPSSSSMSSIDVFMDFTSEDTPTSSETPTTSETPASSSEPPSSSESPSSSTTESLFPVISTETFDVIPEEEEETKEESTTSHTPVITSSPSTISSTEEPSTSSLAPVSEVEVIKKIESDTKEQISVGTSREERPVQSTLTYVIVGLLVALILAVALVLICKKVSGSKKKVRLPKDLEASPGTEMQDMLLPRPAENGVKILPTNGKEKEKEEEKQVLSGKDWDDKNEPIETVTARLSVLAGPQTPVFIHKTLA